MLPSLRDENLTLKNYFSALHRLPFLSAWSHCSSAEGRETINETQKDPVRSPARKNLKKLLFLTAQRTLYFKDTMEQHILQKLSLTIEGATEKVSQFTIQLVPI